MKKRGSYIRSYVNYLNSRSRLFVSGKAFASLLICLLKVHLVTSQISEDDFKNHTWAGKYDPDERRNILARWLLNNCVSSDVSECYLEKTDNIEYEGYDGWYNNLARADSGAIDRPLLRRWPAAYKDGSYEPSGSDRPNPMELSEKLLKLEQVGTTSPNGKSAFLVFFGTTEPFSSAASHYCAYRQVNSWSRKSWTPSARLVRRNTSTSKSPKGIGYETKPTTASCRFYEPGTTCEPATAPTTPDSNSTKLRRTSTGDSSTARRKRGPIIYGPAKTASWNLTGCSRRPGRGTSRDSSRPTTNSGYRWRTPRRPSTTRRS